LRPDHHDHAGIQPTRSDEARLAVVVPVIRASQVPTEKHLYSTLEVEAPLSQRSRPFGRVELDAHQI
jgi:hypothetical protein